jgi:hypothetical protein
VTGSGNAVEVHVGTGRLFYRVVWYYHILNYRSCHQVLVLRTLPYKPILGEVRKITRA